MQKKRVKTAIQMRDQAFNEKDIISVINYLAELQLALNSSRINDGAAD